ncbi:cation:dicarboxylate symporter family transporter [Lacrimispora saccharolytica]|uniref:L-cystine uptake protein TcyP n=1 Tax=Lacrimispora saccharolytica (strain ATCC 35040 / DSM 2544 / NRCC 2533 / WM1) TaxID=610130 RepID=D9R6Q5_LACSW|nr:cation:dicarboxylase symporter family transporter [Lacrimispora saccharolytica]ADL03561.1 sodium:dicarboxylate symporter [[Clostridium] saccharolyticum WM1]QRV18293.1 cation:dicarboxylase symporter family transporter [Lacrimispora saccharolytica]
MAVSISVICFLIYLGVLFVLQKKGKSFNVRVVAGLFGGIIFGAILKTVADDAAVSESLRWISLVGTAYTKLLKMMVIPLIFVSIVCAIINQKSGKNLGKITALVLAILLSTAAVAAVVGGVTATAFGVSAEGLEIGEAESKKTSQLEEKAKEGLSIEETIIDIIPSNPIFALTGQGNNATLSVVLFAAFLGIGVIGVRTYAPEQAEFFGKIMNSLNTLVVEVVMMIIMLTPFGIFSLMTKTIAGSDYTSILRLVTFVLASYTAIFIMFIIHGLILAAVGVSPLTYFKKAMTTLVFAFTSRTSAGTLPLTIRTLTDEMGVDNGVSNLAGSLSTSIGQNGCAAIYPAMLVIMVAPAVGQPITPSFFLLMVVIITFASIGIAGVGGGATFAGITVLSALGLPVGIAGLLVGIEPVIDMARTALNVSDGMITGLVAAKLTNNIDMKVYNDKSLNLEKKQASAKEDL